MVRGQGVSKDKNGVSAAAEGSSGGGCGKSCACGTKQRLAQKHAINQRIAERNLANSKSSNPSPVENKSVNNNSVKKKATPKQKSVDEVVKFIEGSSANSDKKKLKKERQKQERLQALKEQEEKERKIQEAMAREQQRIKEEEKRRAEAEKELSLMSKKQLKKANQRAKKLAEGQGATNAQPRNSINPVPSQVPGAFGKTSYPSSLSQPNLSLEQLKAKHQRELEMMELKHKQALEEEYVRSMYKQSGQASLPPQYQPSRYQPQVNPQFGGLGSSLGSLGSSTGGLGSSFGGLGSSLGGGLSSSLGNLGSTRSPSSPLSSLEDLKAQLNNLTTNTMNQLRSGLMKSSLTGSSDNGLSDLRVNPLSKTVTQLTTQNSKKKKGSVTNVKNDDIAGKQGTNSSLPSGAREALAKAGRNPEDQIRISRNAQGGVDFTPISTKAK